MQSVHVLYRKRSITGEECDQLDYVFFFIVGMRGSEKVGKSGISRVTGLVPGPVRHTLARDQSPFHLFTS